MIKARGEFRRQTKSAGDSIAELGWMRSRHNQIRPVPEGFGTSPPGSGSVRVENVSVVSGDRGNRLANLGVS